MSILLNRIDFNPNTSMRLYIFLKISPPPLPLQYQSDKAWVLRVWSWDSSISTWEIGNVNSVAPCQTSLLGLVNPSVISQPKPLFFQEAFPDLPAQ